MTSATGSRMIREISTEKGLTLLELCLVVLILGLIVTMAVPRLQKSYSSLLVKSEANEIVEQMHMINRRAILSGVPWRFSIWPDGSGYFVERKLYEDYGNQPVVAVKPTWHVESRHYLQNGSVLTPVDTFFEWRPDGRFPRGKLAIVSSKGYRSEVTINEAKIIITSDGRDD